jgi:hypothetical protein
MDESVRRAMARWPDVPAVFGWLSLDRRGRWLIRGEPVTNPALLAFIGRNYGSDEQGRWHFQNGPQRVYVALEYAPWVLRLHPDGSLATHTGSPAGEPRWVAMDEEGAVLVDTARGLGLLDDRDLDAFSACLCSVTGAPLDGDDAVAAVERLHHGAGGAPAVRLAGRVLVLERIASGEAPVRFGFEPKPAAPA